MEYGDRIGETTTTTGTGTLTLSGTAVTAHRTFGASVTAGGANNLTDGGTTEILIVAIDSNGNPSGAWEVCESVFTVSGNTVTRGTLLSSSTGSRVSFASGTKNVYVVSSANYLLKLPSRRTTTTSTATLTVNADTTDFAEITAQAEALTIANPTGTPVNGQGLLIKITDNGTARALSYGAQFRAVGSAKATTTTLGKTMYIGCIWDSTDSKWDCYPAMIEV